MCEYYMQEKRIEDLVIDLKEVNMGTISANKLGGLALIVGPVVCLVFYFIQQLGVIGTDVDPADGNAVVSALTANEDARDYISENVSNIILIYLKCPIEICIKRDSRGLYQGVKEGKIDPKTLIGLEEPYPPPLNPDLIISTNENKLFNRKSN